MPESKPQYELGFHSFEPNWKLHAADLADAVRKLLWNVTDDGHARRALKRFEDSRRAKP